MKLQRFKTITLLLISLWMVAISAFAFASASDSKIIAIGDIHGDYDAYESILQTAGLIDPQGKWSGGKAVLVQTGDIPDRGPDTRQIFEHLRKLQKQARKQGGQVVTLIGNHEAMNMTRDLRFVHPGEYAAYATDKSAALRNKTYKANKSQIEAFYKAKDPELTAIDIKAKWEATSPLGKLEHQAAWSPRGTAGKWVIKNDVTTMIDGNLFVHGGLSEKYTAYSLGQINKAARSALRQQDSSEDAIINDPLGPLWYRGNAKQLDQTHPGQSTLTQAEEIDLVLKTYGAQRIIVGHTPERAGIQAQYSGKLIQIDTGASAYYGGTRSFLRIENGQVYAHDNGNIRQLK